MLKLKKFAFKFEKKPFYKPLDTLFIMRKRGTLLYRCYGYGELRERFVDGEPLTGYPPYAKRKEQVVPEVEKDTKIKCLIPEKDPSVSVEVVGRPLLKDKKTN